MTLAVKVNCQHLEFFMVWPPHSASSMQRITHFSHTLHTHTQCGDMLQRVLVERVTWLQISKTKSHKLQCENITGCQNGRNTEISMCV